jgi:hypothetical protein
VDSSSNFLAIWIIVAIWIILTVCVFVHVVVVNLPNLAIWAVRSIFLPQPFTVEWQRHGLLYHATRQRSETSPANEQYFLDTMGVGPYLVKYGSLHYSDLTGQLWSSRRFPGRNEPIVAVRVIDTTTNEVHWLRVPPEFRRNSPRAAVAWTFRMERGDYYPAVEA